MVANNFQNQDLFWAVRGGGGGTFGVVVSVTLKTFPEPPVIFQNLNATFSDVGSMWKYAATFFAQLPNISDAGGSGYWYCDPTASVKSDSIWVRFGISVQSVRVPD